MKVVSIHSLVDQAVLSLGECTVSRVLARVGCHVPAAKANAAFRRRRRAAISTGKRSSPLEIGKRQIVSEALLKLFRQGRIRRVRKGVYAPKPLQLFQAS